MKLHIATVIAAAFSATLAAQTSVPLTAPQEPTVELLSNKPGSCLGQRNLVPLQRKFPGYGGEALDDALVNSVYFMTSLNPTGPGSISAAPSGSYVVPLVAGKIVSDKTLRLPQDNIRFLGSLAPGHLSINGSKVFNPSQLVRFAGNNALWEHFSIRASEVPDSYTGQSSHSSFGVQDGNNGVVLGNLSVHFGDDDSGALWYDTTNVTFYRLLVGHATDRSSKGGNHNYGLMAGGGSGRLSMFQNVMMTSGRSPLIGNSDPAQVVNNLVYPANISGGGNQLFAFNQGGSPHRTVHINYHDNLDVPYLEKTANVWTGQRAPTLLEAYLNNNQYRNCADNSYTNMGLTSSVSDTGTIVNSPHSMPSLPAITDLTKLEDFLLPRAGNFTSRDFLDDDVMSYTSTCTVPPVYALASDYFPDPWRAGPIKPALTFWDQSSPDGLSDAAKQAFGIAPGTNLLSPNDGRWEAVVDFHSGGLLSASIE
ncbi:hypothetical protein OAM69_04720 [bacterium]|nr:hypothetical protein [bacterium]